MHKQNSFWYQFAALVLALVLLVPILAACGSTPTATPTPVVTPTAAPTATVAPTATKTPTATVAPTATSTIAPTPTPTVAPVVTPTSTPTSQPIKLGALSSWSGPAGLAGGLADQAISVVQAQLKKQGGILGGRSVEFVKSDDGTTVAGNQTAYTKLALQDKVSAVLFGGAIAAILTAASDSAEKYKVPLFSLSPTPSDIATRPYTIPCVYPNADAVSDLATQFIVSKLKPKTLAFLMSEQASSHSRLAFMRPKLEAAGAKIVSEQYTALDVVDYSSYLTRIKYLNPDVLVADYGAETAFNNIYQQIAELGGWGNIKVVSTSGSSTGTPLKKPAADGSYNWLIWMPGLPYPGAQEMEQAFKDTVGSTPTPSVVFSYYALWVAIKAIQLAGSDDPAKIAQAARSGQLNWDSPTGPFKINTDGSHTNKGLMAQYTGGKLVLVQ